MSSDNGLDLDNDRPSECRIATFIRKLYTMLEESLHPEIFDWTEDGESIIIKKPAEFGSQLLPKYFKHNRITSFIRQLNMYNFQKKRSRNAEHIYSHDLFKRGHKHILIQIKRKVKDGFLPNQHSHTHSAVGSDSNTNDLNSIVSENKMLKSLQDQTASRIKLLEDQLNELTNENKSLHYQVQQQKNKQNTMMDAFIKMRRENNPNQPFMYEKAGDDPHKQFATKGALLKNNSNSDLLPDGKMASMQATEAALYGGVYPGPDMKHGVPMAAINPAQMRQPLKPILNNVGPYDAALYYSMGKDGDAMIENYRNSMLADYNNNMNILGKRAAQLEEERKLYGDFEGDLTKRFMKNPGYGFDERTTLNLGDMKRLRQGFFSSIGDKEYENTFDTEIDLLCFQ